ncbi:calmodulin-A-like [Diaphorina citri]|uniref:Calmodulin-A-like n=1 Tax=Diaphorina citri TaxID=121845 RepID=A0A1S3D426_DIACI|nr:calmodulin-A-like [Diaphorina citri]KAI5702885.1 hypothetical protein M8J75_005302 [Diaphorina citri]KAI5733243.1 hypothetical protein M8J76_009500 [Diaphorina citri]
MVSLSGKLTLDEEQITEWKEAFALFDKNGSGKIVSKYVGTVMRAIGRNPTEQELEDLLKEVDPDDVGSVDFESFLKLMANHIPNVDSTAELLEAFQVFDKDGVGYISSVELKHILTNLGEKLSDQEVDELIGLADENNTGHVRYEEFAKVMTLA